MGVNYLDFENSGVEVGEPQNSEKNLQKLGFGVGSPNFGT